MLFRSALSLPGARLSATGLSDALESESDRRQSELDGVGRGGSLTYFTRGSSRGRLCRMLGGGRLGYLLQVRVLGALQQIQSLSLP